MLKLSLRKKVAGWAKRWIDRVGTVTTRVQPADLLYQPRLCVCRREWQRRPEPFCYRCSVGPGPGVKVVLVDSFRPLASLPAKHVFCIGRREAGEGVNLVKALPHPLEGVGVAAARFLLVKVPRSRQHSIKLPPRRRCDGGLCLPDVACRMRCDDAIRRARVSRKRTRQATAPRGRWWIASSPPSKGRDAIHQCPRADSRLLSGFRPAERALREVVRMGLRLVILPDAEGSVQVRKHLLGHLLPEVPAKPSECDDVIRSTHVSIR